MRAAYKMFPWTVYSTFIVQIKLLKTKHQAVLSHLRQPRGHSIGHPAHRKESSVSNDHTGNHTASHHRLSASSFLWVHSETYQLFSTKLWLDSRSFSLFCMCNYLCLWQKPTLVFLNVIHATELAHEAWFRSLPVSEVTATDHHNLLLSFLLLFWFDCFGDRVFLCSPAVLELTL